MADPRIKCRQADLVAQSSLRNYTNLLGKAGDLAVLNKVGGGQVGNGLRSLVSISNAIRTGTGALPNSIGGSVAAGASWVLDNVGLSPSTMTAVNKFNPSAVNIAQSEATQVFNKVKQGGYKLSDVAGSVQGFQNVIQLGQSIYPTTATDDAVAVDCKTSPYAEDLIALAPKHKFLFVVQFVFNDEYHALGGRNFAFVVKKSSRPSAKFAMEDVNYYNFRTKVVTKTEFEEMSMSFHDDIRNNVMVFYNAYRNAMSPITNLDHTTFFTDPEQAGMKFDATSMMTGTNHDAVGVTFNQYSASRGPLMGDKINVIREIKLYHIYEYGTQANIYQFLNPRITSLDLDDVDMAVGSEGNEITLKFNYDNVFIQTSLDASHKDVTTPAGYFAGQEGAIYGLRNNPGPTPTGAGLTDTPASMLSTARTTVTSAATNVMAKASDIAGNLGINTNIPGA